VRDTFYLSWFLHATVTSNLHNQGILQMNYKFAILALGALAACAAHADTVSGESMTGKYKKQTGTFISQNNQAGQEVSFSPGDITDAEGFQGTLKDPAKSKFSVGTSAAYFQTQNATSKITYVNHQVNTTGVDQSYNFNFGISGGNVYSQGGLGAFGESSFIGSVKLNGATVWETSLSCSKLECKQTGVDLGYKLTSKHLLSDVYNYEAQGAFSGYQTTLNLGSYKPGEALNIEYSLEAMSSFSKTAEGSGSTVARIGTGDFSKITGMSIIAVSAVPEPASFGLLGAGLCVVGANAWVRRRRAARRTV
jgi:hypothetical protein